MCRSFLALSRILRHFPVLLRFIFSTNDSNYFNIFNKVKGTWTKTGRNIWQLCPKCRVFRRQLGSFFSDIRCIQLLRQRLQYRVVSAIREDTPCIITLLPNPTIQSPRLHSTNDKDPEQKNLYNSYAIYNTLPRVLCRTLQWWTVVPVQRKDWCWKR